VRRSTIRDVTEKTGTSGRLVFVKLRHVVAANGVDAVTEDQDIVYREAARAPSQLPVPDGVRRIAGETRRSEPDATRLFRFSALTFNAHRIHYDRDYARDVEYYPGLVVQGPYIATLLMDHLFRLNPESRISAFRFRSKSPLFDTAPFDLCLSRRDGSYDIWAVDADGREAMSAEAILDE